MTERKNSKGLISTSPKTNPGERRYLLTLLIQDHLSYFLYFLLFSFLLQVVRLHLLLTVKESAINVPMNLEARRRITFFTNSLYMNMPSAPKVRDMLSFRSVSFE